MELTGRRFWQRNSASWESRKSYSRRSLFLLLRCCVRKTRGASAGAMLTRASGVSRGRGTEAEWAADSVFTSPSRRHCASSSRDCQHTWAMNTSAPWCLPASIYLMCTLHFFWVHAQAAMQLWLPPGDTLFFLSLWTRHSTQSSVAPDCFLFLIDYMGMWEREKRGGGTAKHVTFHLEQSSPPELPACVP
jgi:hypothetical protein